MTLPHYTDADRLSQDRHELSDGTVLWAVPCPVPGRCQGCYLEEEDPRPCIKMPPCVAEERLDRRDVIWSATQPDDVEGGPI